MINKRSVCIIGAGPAGLVSLKNFLAHREEFGEIICYEQTKTLGGTWNYVENTGIDENGLPIHSSMYKNLITNTAKYVTEYPDFDMNSENCFLRHEEMLQYYHDYAKHFKLFDYIQFECVARKVSFEANVWKVKIESFKKKEIFERQFDVVMLCLGLFGTPRFVDCNGIEKFKGQVVHSHDYRTPDKYKDKKILVIGSGFSGTDIAVELAKFSDKIYLLDRKEESLLKDIKNVEIINGNLVDFTETGTKIKLIKTKEIIELENLEVILACTGYRINLDILDKSCGLSITPENTVSGLYRHTINIAHPTMGLLGIVALTPQGKLFHIQSLFVINHLLGKFKLPSVEEMHRRNDEEIKSKLNEGLRLKDRHKFSLSMVSQYFRLLEEEAHLGSIVKPVLFGIYIDTRKNINENTDKI